MKYLRFMGEYTGGRDSICYPPYEFFGREPVEVDPETDMGRRLCGNPEFEAVHVHEPANYEQLDHDGDGKPGGSISAVEEIKDLRAEYQAKFGKRAFNGWDADTLREKLA